MLELNSCSKAGEIFTEILIIKQYQQPKIIVTLTSKFYTLKIIIMR